MRETEACAHAKLRVSLSLSAKRFKREVHPDLAEALAAAEDTLSTAFGRPVKVRARGDGCRVELDFDTPGEAVELAERDPLPSAPARRLSAATIARRGRLAQSVRAPL